MSRASTLIGVIAMFGLALGAGIIGGRLSAHAPVWAGPPPGVGSLSDQLGLSPAQREQMRQIWEGVGKVSHDCQHQAEAAQDAQNSALLALMTDEQRTKWKLLSEQTAARIAVLKKQRDDAFASAVEKTHGILNEPQRQMYDQIVRDRVGGSPDSSVDH